jgi:aldose 1-epimerase
MISRIIPLILPVAAMMFSAALPAKAMSASTSKSPYGKMPDGTPVDEYTLTNANGLVLKVITYGAIITEMRVPDRDGRLGDVVLGFDRLEPYLTKSPYFGAAIGRVGNRIANGRFILDGKTYTLAVNNGPNHLHGGIRGFDKVVWQAEPGSGPDGPAVVFHYTSADGEEGYPGTVNVTMTYTLTDKNELRFDYRATSDKDTPINLTNHSYWNLAGRGDILGHMLTLHAASFTPADDTLIPTGKIEPVAGTPMDFTRPKAIGRDLGQLTDEPQGYDWNFVLDGGGGKGLAPAARVYDPSTGRVMDVLTDQPGIQFYSGNFLDGTLTGKQGAVYRQHDGLCLETQHFPDSVNHPNFPSTILHPGEIYQTTTVYRFSVR